MAPYYIYYFVCYYIEMYSKIRFFLKTVLNWPKSVLVQPNKVFAIPLAEEKLSFLSIDHLKSSVSKIPAFKNPKFHP